MAVDLFATNSKDVLKVDTPTLTCYVSVSLSTENLDRSNYDC